MFYDGRENIQQFKYVRFLFVFINMRKSMEQGEVSALFQEKRKKKSLTIRMSMKWKLPT